MRNFVIGAAVVAGLALGGCKSKSEEVQAERAELRETRTEIQENVADIRQEAAQERAEINAAASEDIADEREELQEQREDLAEARAELAEERVDEAGMGGSGAAGRVQGRLGSTFGANLTVRDAQGVEHKLGVDDHTQVTYNGMKVELDDFNEGTEVRASFVHDGDDKVARDVVIISPVKE